VKIGDLVKKKPNAQGLPIFEEYGIIMNIRAFLNTSDIMMVYFLETKAVHSFPSHLLEVINPR
jgi:hypothetical protein